jgi:hypothetical protein
MALIGVAATIFGMASIDKLMAWVAEIFIAGLISLPSLTGRTVSCDDGIHNAASVRKHVRHQDDYNCVVLVEFNLTV